MAEAISPKTRVLAILGRIRTVRENAEKLRRKAAAVVPPSTENEPEYRLRHLFVVEYCRTVLILAQAAESYLFGDDKTPKLEDDTDDCKANWYVAQVIETMAKRHKFTVDEATNVLLMPIEDLVDQAETMYANDALGRTSV